MVAAGQRRNHSQVRFCCNQFETSWRDVGSFMDIAYRPRSLREQKKLSQGDLEKRTGLLRCYISRVENGHTVPAVETLERMARAPEMPLYRLLHARQTPPAPLYGGRMRAHEFDTALKS